jgi:hypothetical protein
MLMIFGNRNTALQKVATMVTFVCKGLYIDFFHWLSLR